MAEIMYCKHCGAEVPGNADICPKCFPVYKKKEAAPAALLLVLVCSSLLMVGSSYVNVKTIEPIKKTETSLPGDMRTSAYNSALQFVDLQFTGEKTFSPLDQTPIQRRSGNQFVVIVSADETGASGEPLRNSYRVELEFAEGNWKLIRIQQ